MLGLLGLWASQAGFWTVMALYGGPYLVVNMWLIVYTWLQHTDVDVPHLHADGFSYMRGAFLTIDRPYPKLIDWLHHRIGTTHVAHHIDCTIPHYHAREATGAIAAAFPEAYLFEPSPVHVALWRVATSCIALKRRSPGDSRYVFVPFSSWCKN
jgi:omega-6 fatty acid desaturase (delta-12 desaturase)